jgi:HEAT repeat protein
MEKKIEARKRRGQVPDQLDERFQALTNAELIDLLTDANPGNRTAAARLLGERNVVDAVPFLCSQFQKESALYTRMAISEALAVIGEPSLPGLTALLGKIGQNQHEILPVRGFYKKSYPLPRDLAARTIIRIGQPALPFLEKVVSTGDRDSLLEAVDAIGHIAFYTKDIRSESVLLTAFDRYRSDTIVCWKIVRAFQSFPTDRVSLLLGGIICRDERPELRWEAVRSLGQLNTIVPPEVILRAQMDVHEEVRNMALMFLT